MLVLIEENSNPTNEVNAFNVDTPERIAYRNRQLLEQGNSPNWIVIGVAASPTEASAWLRSYRAARATRA